MKKLYFFLVAIFIATGLFAQAPYCDTTLWQHTYWPGRLPEISSCVSITGKVGTLLDPTLTLDGDYHIYILIDTQYNWMIHYNNPANWTNDGFFPGYLNVEEVCAGTPVDTYVLASCHNFTNHAYVPNMGEYVRVAGPLCYDTFHHWNEIHPVTSCTVVALGIPDEGNTFLNDLKLFPQPASAELNFAFSFPPHEATYIRIFNYLGREVGSYQLAETSTLTLPTNNWPPGEYIYTISQDRNRNLLIDTEGQKSPGDKVLKTGKFVVMH